MKLKIIRKAVLSRVAAVALAFLIAALLG